MEQKSTPVTQNKLFIRSLLFISFATVIVCTYFMLEEETISTISFGLYVPSNSSPIYHPRLTSSTKRILYWTSFYGGKSKSNRKIKCGLRKEYTCELKSDKSLVESSHALIFHGWREDMLSNTTVVDGVKTFTPTSLPAKRFPDQYYVLFMLESPRNYHDNMRCYDDQFNCTMTYRPDSEAYVPYGKFELLEKPLNFTNATLPLLQTKTKLVAWISSNCGKVPSNRLELVEKLQNHIPVDVYGKCGKLKCGKGKKNCKPSLGKQYKFYLSLENTLCQDYMTEKVFEAYLYGMVPVVYGSASYNLFLPPGSYINMNSFPSAESLAQYLFYLDKNPEEYAKYFEWKERFKLINKYDFNSGYCQICIKLHQDYPLGIQKIIPNMTEWLEGNPRKKYRACSVPLLW